MGSKHTPGPWSVTEDGYIVAGEDDDYAIIANTDCSDLDGDEREANARLMALAPTLLALLIAGDWNGQ